MSYSQKLLYEQAYAIHINKPADALFYYFDYDERYYAINMEFQHFHPFYEIFILLDEEAFHIIEGKYYQLKKYDMVFLRPARLHKSEYPPGKPRKRLIINFSIPQHAPFFQHGIDKLFSIFNTEEPVYRFSPERQQPLFQLLNDIFSLGKNADATKELIIHTKFMEFLYTIYGQAKYNTYQQGLLVNAPAARIYTITEWIHENYHQSLTLNSLAEHFNISPYYLSHQFREVTGFTVVTYIQMTRVRNVQQMLLSTDMTITDIAESCGFNSFSQFNRTFNKFCRIPPSRYRESPHLDRQLPHPSE